MYITHYVICPTLLHWVSNFHILVYSHVTITKLMQRKPTLQRVWHNTCTGLRALNRMEDLHDI